MSQDKFFYGGQAVLEGVMMRGRTTYAVAVRKPDGEIQVLRERLRSIIYTHPSGSCRSFAAWPGCGSSSTSALRPLLGRPTSQPPPGQSGLGRTTSGSPW